MLFLLFRIVKLIDIKGFLMPCLLSFWLFLSFSGCLNRVAVAPETLSGCLKIVAIRLPLHLLSSPETLSGFAVRLPCKKRGYHRRRSLKLFAIRLPPFVETLSGFAVRIFRRCHTVAAFIA